MFYLIDGNYWYSNKIDISVSVLFCDAYPFDTEESAARCASLLNEQSAGFKIVRIEFV